MPRGILGLPKDPKNQILFSFNARKGDEWPSSDSDDSDYLPSDEDIPVQRKKTKKSNPSKSKHSHSTANKHSTHKSGVKPAASTSQGHQAANGQNKALCSGKRKRNYRLLDDDRFDLFGEPDKHGQAVNRRKGWSWSKLPPEIWLKIFHYVTDFNGAIPFLCRISKVCVGFNELSCEPSLWRYVDLSYGWIKSEESTLKWLCENRLSQCKELNLSSWKNPSSALIAYIEHLQHLNKINLSFCKNLTHAGVMALHNCPQLQKLDLAYTSLDAMKGVKYLAEKRGETLTHLNIAGSLGNSTGHIINILADNCKNLEVLDFSDVRFTITLDVERLQRGCGKLKVLRLACTSFSSKPVSRAVQDTSFGFPDLEQLSLAVKSLSASSTAIDNRFINRVLKASSALQLLDLRGCAHFTCLGLLDLPVTDLKYLYISQCSAVKHDLDVVLKKWCHSLVEIDLSWNSVPEDYLEQCMQVFIDEVTPCKLENLDLSGTSVKAETLRLIMSFAKNLKHIDLTSCRGLSRGMKRKYSESNIRELHQMLDETGSEDNIP